MSSVVRRKIIPAFMLRPFQNSHEFYYLPLYALPTGSQRKSRENVASNDPNGVELRVEKRIWCGAVLALDELAGVGTIEQP